MATVIDIASGTGYGAAEIARLASPKSVVGIEFNQEAVDYANAKYAGEKVSFKQGSILDIPFPDNSFDFFTSFETIEHVADEVRQIAEIKRVLKPNGLYIMSVPNAWDNTNNPHHLRDYDYKSICEVINDNFEMVEMFNQNGGGENEYNHGQPRGMVPTTAENQALAECFFVVAKNTKKQGENI